MSCTQCQCRQSVSTFSRYNLLMQHYVCMRLILVWLAGRAKQDVHRFSANSNVVPYCHALRQLSCFAAATADKFDLQDKGPEPSLHQDASMHARIKGELPVLCCAVLCCAVLRRTNNMCIRLQKYMPGCLCCTVLCCAVLLKLFFNLQIKGLDSICIRV